MSNYKIHIDKPLPHVPDIQRHQDFDGLYQKYRSARRFEFWRNLYRKPGYFAALVGLLAVGYLVVESAFPPKADRLLAPPLAAHDIALASEALPISGTPLAISPQTQLLTPPDAFVDENGLPATGRIELRYRELNTPWEIFLAGAPLQYDSAGERRLAAAAMIEVLAFQEGKPVFLKEDKHILLSYLAADPGIRYQHYFLDTAARMWDDRGPDELVELPNDQPAIPPRPRRPALLEVRDVKADTLIPKAVAMPPAKPGKPFRISIDNMADFPEMRGYEDMYWEKVEDSHANDPNREQVRWSTAKMQKGRGDLYRMRLTRRENGREIVRTVVARPMFRALSSADAQAIYDERLAAYAQALAAYEAGSTAGSDHASAVQAAERAAAEADYRAALQDWEEKYGALAGDAAAPQYLRQVMLRQLGIHALGHVISLPEKGFDVSIEFPQNPGEETTGHTLFVSLHTGALSSATADDRGAYTLPVTPEEIAEMWLLSDSGRLARGSLPTGTTRLQAEWIEIPDTAETEQVRALLGL